MAHCVEEGIAGTGPDTREEQQQSDLPYGQVGRQRHHPADPAAPLESAEHQGDEQRPAGEAQTHRLATADGDRHHAHDHTQHHADRQRPDVHLGLAADRVTEVRGHCREVRASCQHPDAVTVLEPGLRVGDDVEVAAPQTGDDGGQPIRKVELPNPLAHHLAS